MKRLCIDSVIVGFALFAMFFGAGNIIFPPYVGLTGGPEWFLGYICYYIADVGLALLAIFAMLKANSIDKVEGIMFRLGKKPALLMMGAAVVCLGPLLAVPRTGALTYSMAVVNLAGADTTLLQVISTVVYFALVFAFSIRESALVDIVGRFLTPLLVAGLLLMIILGTLNPIGPISDKPMIDNVVWTGISSGYQTLDVLAALVFGLIVVNALKAKGYTSDSHKFISVGIASLIAGLLLLVVYGGLCYLGAQVSTIYPEDMDKGKMVVNIAGMIFGGTGATILGVTVALACLTTGVALTGATATFFNTLSKGKISYQTVVIIVCAFSTIMANKGLEYIIALAAPILTFIYPGALVVVILSLFDSHIKNDNVFRFATAGALVVSFCEVMGWYFPETFSFIKGLPFEFYGFGWVFPAVVCGVIGLLVKAPKAHVQEDPIDFGLGDQ